MRSGWGDIRATANVRMHMGPSHGREAGNVLAGGIQHYRRFGGLLRVGRGRSGEPLAVEIFDEFLASRSAERRGRRPWIAESPVALRVASGSRRTGMKTKFFGIRRTDRAKQTEHQQQPDGVPTPVRERRHRFAQLEWIVGIQCHSTAFPEFRFF